MRLKQQLEAIRSFLRERFSTRALVIGGLTILASISLILMLLRVAQISRPPTGVAPTPTPPSLTTPTPEPTRSYFINRTSSLFPVTGYSWIQQDLIYSTPKGIYRAGLNASLVTVAIEEIYWNQNGQAIYRSGGNWFWFDASLGQTKPIAIDGDNPRLSPNGQLVATDNNGKLEVTALSSGAKVSTELTEELQAIRWSAAGNSLLVAERSPTELTVRIFDANLNLKETISLETDTILLDVSPDATLLLLYQPGKLLLRSSKTGTKQVEFQLESQITGNFIDPKRAVIVETTVDSLGREFNYFWRISETGKKEYLANSLPIPRKIDTSLPLIPNPPQSALPIVEKRGPLWLISLLPNLLPTYSEQGLTFFPLSAAGDHDVGP